MAQNLFSPFKTQEGASLANLVSSLYSGDGGEAKRAEREAVLENRRLEKQLKLAQIAEHERKRVADENAKRAEADNIVNMVNAIAGGQQQGDDVRAAFGNSGVLPSQPETADMPGIMGGYKPPGYDAAMRVTSGLYGERALGGKSFKSAQEGAASAQKQNIIADALAGLVSTDQAKGLAPVMRALKGDPMFNDSQGRVLDYSTGVLNESGAQAGANVAKTTADAGASTARGRLADTQRGVILPTQTVTGPGGITIPVSGADVSRNLTARMFGPKAPGEVDPNAPPPGLRLKPGEIWNPTQQRVEAVPGSAEHVRRANLHANDLGALQAMKLKTDDAKNKIDEILGDSRGFQANFGGYNAYASRLLPGDNTQAMRMRIESLKSSIKAAGLELMRAGGSIGQITQAEWPIVEGMIARIDPVLGEAAAKHEFEKVKVYLDNLVRNAEAKYQTEWGGSQFAGPSMAPVAPNVAADGAPRPRSQFPKVANDADWAALPPGTEFEAPDGTIRVK